MDTITIIGIIVSSVLLLVGLVILIKSIHLKINTTLLILVIVFSAIGNLLAISGVILYTIIGQILVGLSFIFLYFHYESLASSKVSKIITPFLLMTYAIVVSFNILLIIGLYNPALPDPSGQAPQEYYFELDEPVYRSAFIIQFYLSVIIGLTAFIRSFIVIFQTYQLSKSKPALIDSIGLGALIIYRALFLPRYFLNLEQFTLISSIALGFSIIGLLLILMNYTINSDYLYLLPFPIYSFMIYNKSGVLCYSRKVAQDQPQMEGRDHLISGAFTAISNLIQENLGRDAKIKHIDAQQYQISFNPLPDDTGTLVVIAYGTTPLFLHSLRRFISNLSSKLLASLKDTVVYTDFEQELDKLIQKSYPYVNFAK
jgi:hypothetical protein